MGFILQTPQTVPPDSRLGELYRRLNLNYATMRSNYRESLTEALVVGLCNKTLEEVPGCKKAKFEKRQQTTTITFAGPTGSTFAVTISPDGYGAGTGKKKNCPCCGQQHDGKPIGGLNWTNAHNVINHGTIEKAIPVALAATLTGDPRLTGTQTPAVGYVVKELTGVAAGYNGPAVSFAAGEQCPVCEIIHASDCLIQRHHRCLQHAQTFNYRAIQANGTKYIRGNEAIVGMQFGATRLKPEGDLKRLTTITLALASKLAEAVVERMHALWGDTKADQPLLADLMLAEPRLVWEVRRALMDGAGKLPLPPVPPGKEHVVILNAVPPVATSPPVQPPLPQLPDTVTKDEGPPGLPDVPLVGSKTKATPGGTDLSMYIGSLKQRALGAPYASHAVEQILKHSSFDKKWAPDLSKYKTDREQLHYLLVVLWEMHKKKDPSLSNEAFETLLKIIALASFDRPHLPRGRMAEIIQMLGGKSNPHNLMGRNQK